MLPRCDLGALQKMLCLKIIGDICLVVFKIPMGSLINVAYLSRGRSESVTFPLPLVLVEIILMYISCQDDGSR